MNAQEHLDYAEALVVRYGGEWPVLLIDENGDEEAVHCVPSSMISAMWHVLMAGCGGDRDGDGGG